MRPTKQARNLGGGGSLWAGEKNSLSTPGQTTCVFCARPNSAKLRRAVVDGTTIASQSSYSRSRRRLSGGGSALGQASGLRPARAHSNKTSRCQQRGWRVAFSRRLV